MTCVWPIEMKFSQTMANGFGTPSVDGAVYGERHNERGVTPLVGVNAAMPRA